MTKSNSAFHTFWSNEQGQDLVEYSLLLGVLALSVLSFLPSYKLALRGLWSKLDITVRVGP